MTFLFRLPGAFLQACRTAPRGKFCKTYVPSKIVSRSGGSYRVGYRCTPPNDPLVEFAIDATMTGVWFYMFWMFYHNGGALINKGVVYTEYEHLTDDELGIKMD